MSKWFKAERTFHISVFNQNSFEIALQYWKNKWKSLKRRLTDAIKYNYTRKSSILKELEFLRSHLIVKPYNDTSSNYDGCTVLVETTTANPQPLVNMAKN